MAVDTKGLANELAEARERASASPMGGATPRIPGAGDGGAGVQSDDNQHFDRGSSRSISPGEQTDLVQHVKRLFYRSRQHRRPLVDQWIKNYEITRNRSWGGIQQASWMPCPEVPEIYPILSAIIGWETDQRPTFEVSPAYAPYSPTVQFYNELADDLQTVMQNVWRVEDFDGEIEKMLWDAKLYGTGIIKTIWDPTLDGGIGNAMLQRIDPFTFYPDPDARSMKDAQFFIEVYTVSMQEAERRFPGAINKIQNGAWAEATDESPTILSDISPRLPMANPGAISPATSPQYGLPGQTNRIDVTDDSGLTIFESWLRTPCEITSMDDAGEEITRRYDTWRCVVVAGNVILFDEMADNIYEHGQHPYDRYVPHDTGEFWGFSLAEMLAPSQKSINRLLAAIEHNIWLMGNPVFKESVRAGTTRQSMTNKPGQRLQLNTDNATAEYLQPPQLHPQLSSDLIRFYIGEMERISGLSAIVRGSTPTGRNAEGVIDSVQEAAFVRIRLGLRGLERTLKSAGEKVASLIVDFYDTPRMIAMIGESGERTSLALRPNHFYTPGPNGMTPMKFQLNISAGSMDAQSRGARIAEADALFAMGAIDSEAALEAHDFPNRNIITARVREMQAANGTLGQPPGARQRTGRQT